MSSSCDLLAHAISLQDYMVSARRIIHRVPELGFEEHTTSEFIADRLRGLGLKVRTGVCGTGVLAVVEGIQPRPVIALRADMDAVPVMEETGLPYASEREGVMHACAHDMHCAALLGVAALLKNVATELAGTVVLMFQPAEETDGGARAFIDEGIFEEYAPDAVFGLHMWPDLPVGEVGISAGPVMASLDSFDIQVHGTSAHGAMPHRGRDAIVAASAVVMGLQQIVSRNVDPMESAVMTVGTLNAGAARNIIANRATLEGTVRTLSGGTRDLIAARVDEVVKMCAKAYGVEAVVEYDRLLPPLVNDVHISDIAVRSARAILGATCVQPIEPSMAADDFSLYADKTPGCYLFFGCTPEDDMPYPLHSGHFSPSEGALSVAASVLTQLCIEFFRSNSARIQCDLQKRLQENAY